MGYVFVANIDMLLDAMADLCADFDVYVGIAAGKMLLLNVGRGPEGSLVPSRRLTFHCRSQSCYRIPVRTFKLSCPIPIPQVRVFFGRLCAPPP